MANGARVPGTVSDSQGKVRVLERGCAVGLYSRTITAAPSSARLAADICSTSSASTAKGLGVTPLPGHEFKTGASGHSEYGQNAAERMAGYNLAAVLLNRPDLAVPKTPGP